MVRLTSHQPANSRGEGGCERYRCRAVLAVPTCCRIRSNVWEINRQVNHLFRVSINYLKRPIPFQCFSMLSWFDILCKCPFINDQLLAEFGVGLLKYPRRDPGLQDKQAAQINTTDLRAKAFVSRITISFTFNFGTCSARFLAKICFRQSLPFCLHNAVNSRNQKKTEPKELEI